MNTMMIGTATHNHWHAYFVRVGQTVTLYVRDATAEALHDAIVVSSDIRSAPWSDKQIGRSADLAVRAGVVFA